MSERVVLGARKKDDYYKYKKGCVISVVCGTKCRWNEAEKGSKSQSGVALHGAGVLKARGGDRYVVFSFWSGSSNKSQGA